MLVLEGRSRAEKKKELADRWEEITIGEHMQYYEEKGITGKEAMRLVAADRGVSRRDVYQYLVREKEETKIVGKNS